VNSFRGKILVIRGGAIGDFILTLPAIAALRAQFPDAHLEVLGYPHIAQLAVAGGLVNRVQPIEARALAGFFARHAELSEDLVDYFSEFDVIISYLYDPDEIFQTNLHRCLQGQFIAGPHRPDEEAGLHAASAYLKPLERLAIFDVNHIPQLSLNSQGSTLNQLALHPGSGSERKNWPETNWAQFINHLVNSTELDLLLVGGEAEGERLQRLSSCVPPERLAVAQSLPLPEVAQLLQRCAGFVGHDSGISHLAAAVGLPGLILWGDTAEAIWRPPSEKMILLHSQGLPKLPVSVVIEAFERLPLRAMPRSSEHQE
jgi:heptosyltransferase-2